MKIIFMGTPEFAVPSLKCLIEKGYNVCAVMTQPDRPVGRGGKIIISPVKQTAIQNKIPVYQFEKISKEGIEIIKNLSPDIIITAAFGQILSEELLKIPPLGVINVHASILPQYRGAAPIQWAVIKGEKITGITIMKTEKGLDTGDILYCEKTEIKPEETAGELTERLSYIGASALINYLNHYNQFLPQKQNEDTATYFPILRKTDGEINWNMPAESIYNLIRGVNPWPGAYTYYDNQILKIWKAKVIINNDYINKMDGEVIISDSKHGLQVKCGTNILDILELQTINGKKMSAKDFLNGKRIPTGTVFTTQL